MSYQSLREALYALAGTGSTAHQGSAAYTGSSHALLGVATPGLRRLARDWVRENRDATPESILQTLDALFAGDVHEEKTLAALILSYATTTRAVATPAQVEAWLGHLGGWAQVDSLCSNVLQAEQFLADWETWGLGLRRLADDPNINKRRAALVLLTGPVRYSDDPRLLAVSFEIIGRLQAEREILITKAVSWLLRALTLRHRAAVVAYLAENRAALPAIAVREVATKLETGRKTPAKRSTRDNAPPPP
jgi:3-methyladenine DNA glycosylase AlkD